MTDEELLEIINGRRVDFGPGFCAKTYSMLLSEKVFHDIKTGNRQFHIEQDPDELFHRGVILDLYESDGNGTPTNQFMRWAIRYVLRDSECPGLKKGFCIIGF